MSKCYVHLEQTAIGGCRECGKYICSLCLNKISGKYYCDLCARLSSPQLHSNNRHSLKAKELSFADYLLGLGVLLGLITLANLTNLMVILLAPATAASIYYGLKLKNTQQSINKANTRRELILNSAQVNNGIINIAHVSSKLNVNYDEIEKEVHYLVSIGAVSQDLDTLSGNITYSIRK